MRKKVEDSQRDIQSLSMDLEHADAKIEQSVNELKNLKDTARRRGVRERELSEDLKRMKAKNKNSDMEIRRLQDVISSLELELVQQRKETRDWENNYSKAMRRAQDAEVLASTRRTRSESLAEQLKQVEQQLDHAKAEIGSMRRQKQVESQSHESRIKLLMSRIVQAERTKKMSLLSQERLKQDAHLKVEAAERRMERMRMEVSNYFSHLNAMR